MFEYGARHLARIAGLLDAQQCAAGIYKVGNRKGLAMDDKYEHIISCCWRGDTEEVEYCGFPTKEAAWEYVVGEIKSRIKAFEADKDATGKGETIVDWEKVKSDLFEEGMATVEYCQCSAWFDCWGYIRAKVPSRVRI